jgi:hypothetical protein
MAYDFILPILTPATQSVVKTQPEIVTALLVVIAGVLLFSILCWYISFATRKPHEKMLQQQGRKAFMKWFKK